MNWKNCQPVCYLTLIFSLGIFILPGCNRVGAEIVSVASPTRSSQQLQLATKSTIPITTAPDHVYPSPITNTAIAPTQGADPYPSKIDATQRVVSPTPIPTIQPGENVAPNPYPIQDTPVQQQDGLTNSSSYPPPVEGAPIVTSANTVTSINPGEVIPVTPTPLISITATGAPVLTPLATIVKTRLGATDPSTVDLDAGRPQLVVFFAEWCTLCKSIAPVVLNLESQYGDWLNFIYLDIDDAETIPLQKKLNYTIVGKPRIYLIDGLGVILRDWTGYVPLEELQQAITSSITIPSTMAPPPTTSP